MHQMQTVEQQATERSTAADAVRPAGAAQALARGASGHEAGDAGELAHAAVLGYN